MIFSDLITKTGGSVAITPANNDWSMAEIPVSSIHYDSRTVKKDGLFVAMKGLQADGHQYIDEAVKKGASVIIAQQPVDQSHVPVFYVHNARKALALLSAAFYDNPSESVCLIGVTGTNGKTSVTYLLERMLAASGHTPGVIGTINIRYGSQIVDNPVTTPESSDLQRTMDAMRRSGVSHIVMEVSSHAIDLDRIAGCRFDMGIFTNLSQDHLDYHHTMDGYFTIKKRFFEDYLADSGKKSVININDEYGNKLHQDFSGSILTTMAMASDVYAVKSAMDFDGIRATLTTPKGSLEIVSPATGMYNLENIVNAVGAGCLLGLPTSAMKESIKSFKVPGRLERVGDGVRAGIYVDYAHTPDALLNVLTTLMPLKQNRLITVFGCGGDRDKTKRPLMGRIAGQYSDIVCVTSDNPRNEDPEGILADIMAGVIESGIRIIEENQLDQQETGFCIKIADRRKAIGLCTGLLTDGDVMLVAGKGHETYQIIGHTTHAFDDRLEIENALKEHDDY